MSNTPVPSSRKILRRLQEPCPLSDAERAAAAAICHALCFKDRACFDLTVRQLAALFHVAHRTAVGTKDLATFMQVTQSSASRTVSQLVSMDLLAQEIDLSDRRHRLIFLGRTGEELMQGIAWDLAKFPASERPGSDNHDFPERKLNDA
jgi:DNA-binding MarR family transcriptional regulator